MKIETGKFKIITPDDGKWLCNKTARTFSRKVYLGVNADTSQWTEVEEVEKQRLEAEWESDIDSDNEDSEYAEAGKILLGVSE